MRRFNDVVYPNEDFERSGSWIELKSRGNRQFPSKSLVEKFINGEKCDIFHGEAIYMGIQPIDKLCCRIVSQFAISTEIDKYVVELLVKVRFFQHIKLLDERIQATAKKEKLRKLKQDGQFIC